MFWDNYVKLCTKAGKSPNAIAKELCISSGAVTNWKNGAIPHDSTLQRIADHFDVSVAILKDDVFNSTPQYEVKKIWSNDNTKIAGYFKSANNQKITMDITKEEQTLIALYRTLTKEEKNIILRKITNLKTKKRISTIKS